MKPTISILTTTSIDHIATGQSARLYRKQSRVPLTSLANALGLYKAQLSHMEAGRRKWDEDIFAKYLLTCDEIAGNINPEINQSTGE